MRLTCPACGAGGSLEFFLLEAAARKSLLAAFQLPPPLAQHVMTYLGLFRPGKRALSWDRVEKLLAELVGAIKAGSVDRGGRTWPAPLDYWERALAEVLAKRETLTLPLKSHGYLFQVVANIASGAAARGEIKREDQLRRRVGGHGAARPAAEVLAELQGTTEPSKKPSGPPPNWKDAALGRRKEPTE